MPLRPFAEIYVELQKLDVESLMHLRRTLLAQRKVDYTGGKSFVNNGKQLRYHKTLPNHSIL